MAEVFDSPQLQPTAMVMLPLRDVVVYPHMVLPLFVGREKSIAALDTAMERNEPVFLLAQKNADTDEPHAEDMYEMGTVANILQVLKLPDGTVKVLVEGLYRAKVTHIDESGSYVEAHIEECKDSVSSSDDLEALRRTLLSQFDQLAKLNKKIPAEVITTIQGIEDNSRLADTIF